MKKYFGKLLGGVFLFSLSMSLTSCDDILGEWSRPTPNPVTPGGGSDSGTVTAVTIATAPTATAATSPLAQPQPLLQQAWPTVVR